MISAPARERACTAATVSVWQATLTLAKTCIGGGVLALPYAHLRGGEGAEHGVFRHAVRPLL